MIFNQPLYLYFPQVAGQLSYWPSDLQLFSTSGCKRVAQKVDLLLEGEEEEGDRQEL